jgi:hypothetical protein
MLLSLTGSCLLLDDLSPQTALELRNGGRLAAALLGVPLGVTLDEDVEASAGRSVVAKGRASAGVIRGEDLVREVSATRNRAIEVGEGLSITRWGFGIGSEARVHRIVLESINGIWRSERAVSVGLSSTWVQRVDEAAVSADLDGSRASRSGSESPGVCPANWSASGRSEIGRRGVDGGRSDGRQGCAFGDVGTSTPLCQLCSGSTSGSGSSSLLGVVLNIRSLLRQTRSNRRTLGDGDWDGIEGVGIKALRSWRSSNEGSSPEDEIRTHSES